MTNRESTNKTGYVESVKIIDVEKRYRPGPKHYVYVIQVNWTNPSNLFIIYRRYAQFFDLQCKLLDLFAETPVQSTNTNQPRQIPFLPGKIILGRSQVRQIALERKQALDKYCQTLIALPEHISRSRPILEFFHPLDTDVQQSVQSVTHEKQPLDKSSIVISEPAILATYRCLADLNATDKLELSLKRNNIVQVLQKHANGWWFVQHGDQTGFVPGSYLQPSELQPGAREEKTFAKSSNETYIVNTTYKGKDEDELSLEQGSFVIALEKSLSGWWIVKFNGKTGQFPALYLSLCEGRHTPDILQSNSSTMETNAQELGDSDWDDEDDGHPSNNDKFDLYYAHSDHTDSTGECLSFQRGDLIEIHDKHASGWWFGRRVDGDSALTWIPANFLQKELILADKLELNDSLLSAVSSGSSHDETQRIEQDKEEVRNITIYQTIDNDPATDVIYSTVVKTTKSDKCKTIPFKPQTASPVLSHVNVNQNTSSKSVKDLIKLFSGQ
ncbi:unnamed protein product [Adineta ricciae]|uniref:Uncharacterized protein n=1 Tax=Adineta ricciae TaxID=249248 RepID=A0A815NZ68_ADIRI|nr:unnamed protein product [Adineta ricciae]